MGTVTASRVTLCESLLLCVMQQRLLRNRLLILMQGAFVYKNGGHAK